MEKFNAPEMEIIGFGEDVILTSGGTSSTSSSGGSGRITTDDDDLHGQFSVPALSAL